MFKVDSSTTVRSYPADAREPDGIHKPSPTSGSNQDAESNWLKWESNICLHIDRTGLLPPDQIHRTKFTGHPIKLHFLTSDTLRSLLLFMHFVLSLFFRLENKPLCTKEETETECLADQQPIFNNHPVKMAKVVIQLLPIWTTLLMFAVIFQQPATFFIKQGMSMKRNIGDRYKIPPATLQTAITISIVLLMPFYDTIFIPFTRFILRNDNGITTMQRIATGMFLSVIAMVFAATVETKRLASEPETLTIFWLLPQYVLLGVSDIFTVVGMQEFFYSAVPEEMKTMGIALYTSVFGVGSFLSALMVYLVECFTSSEQGKGNWFPDDMREARLDKYYWLLAGASFLSLVVFIVLCTYHKTRQ